MGRDVGLNRFAVAWPGDRPPLNNQSISSPWGGGVPAEWKGSLRFDIMKFPNPDDEERRLP